MKCCGIADFFPYITTKKHAVFIPGRLCDTQGDKPLAINQSAIAGFPWALRKSMVPNRQHNVPNRPWIVAPSVSKLDICPWAKRRRCLPQALSSAPRWSKHSMDNSPLFIDQFAIETPFFGAPMGPQSFIISCLQLIWGEIDLYKPSPDFQHPLSLCKLIFPMI